VFDLFEFLDLNIDRVFFEIEFEFLSAAAFLSS
jgi:hypothetical protein